MNKIITWVTSDSGVWEDLFEGERKSERCRGQAGQKDWQEQHPKAPRLSAECREGTVAGSEWVREKVPGGVWGPAGGEFGYGERLGLI